MSIQPMNLEWLWITEVMVVDRGSLFSYSLDIAPHHPSGLVGFILFGHVRAFRK